MTANKWYCIAQSSTFDSSCGITIYSEGVAVSFTASVRFGSSSINIASCAIDGDILLSVRLRETDNKWCIDLLCNTEFNPTIDITDSPYWEVQNTPAGTGSILAIINDISKEFNTGVKGGESLWQLYNFGTQEKPEYAVVPKDYDGKPIGVVSKTFISFGGHNSGAEEGTGGGITTFDVYIGNDGPYSLVNGRVDLPAYPTADLTGYATEDWVKEQGYLTQHQDISHLLGKDEAKDIYATIIALNEVSDRVETIESIIGIDSKGNVYIKKKADGTARNFYTYGAISFGGNGENSGSGEIIGSSVQYNASVTSGKLLGTLVIDGVDNKIYAPAIPTKLSAFTNDEGYTTEDWVDKQGFLTAHQSLAHLLSKTEAAKTYQPKGNYVTESALNGKGYLTQSKAEDTYQPKGNYAVLDDLNSYLLASTAKNTYATKTALNNTTLRIDTLETTLSIEQGYIDTLQGYFTSGKANKAIADGNGNNIVDTYATKVALNSTNTDLTSLSKELSEFKELVNSLWYLDPDHPNTVRTKLNVVVEQAISFGGYGESSGSGGGITTVTKQMILDALEYIPYDAANPKGYITSSALSGYAKLTDIPSLEGYATLEALNSLSNKVDGYESRIAELEKLWHWSDEHNAVETDHNVVVKKAISFGGYGESSGNGGGVTALSALSDVSLNNLVSGQSLVYENGKWVNKVAGLTSVDWSIVKNKPNYALGDAIGGNAVSANKLTDNTSYTAWGQTFFENGVPKTINGSLTDVTYLAFAETNYGIYRGDIGNATLGVNDIMYYAHNHYFKGGSVIVDSIPITEKTKNGTKYLEIDGNLVITGAVSFGGFGEGGSTGGGITEVTKDMIISALGYTPYNSSNFTRVNIKSTLGISDWALAASKPTYTKSDVGLDNVTNLAASGYLTDLSSNVTNAVSITVGGTTKNISASTLKTSLGLGSFAYKSSLSFSELTGKPTTVNGYGITDAITTSNISSQSVKYATSAGSATKLETSRTIWGQSFNGTGNVSGAMSNVNYITFTGSSYGLYRGDTLSSSLTSYDLGLYSQNLYISGNVGVGTATPNAALHVVGNIVATGSITFGSASDRRLKDNIKSMTDKQALAVLSALNPVTFQWNSTAYELGKLSGVSDGFIADEYEKLIPNSGRDIWANYRAINYERATGYLVKGWQNHETRLEKAERRIKELENELNQYRRA